MRARARGVDLVADAAFGTAVERQIDVDARAEADEAEALAARERGARLDVAQDAPRDQAGHLHAGDVAPVVRREPERVALVLQRSLVERRVDERARVSTSAPSPLPSTGERFECALNTFMNTLILSASRSR